MYWSRRKGISFISMLLQLKRFNMMGGKNGRPVTLAKNLDMSQYVRCAALSMHCRGIYFMLNAVRGCGNLKRGKWLKEENSFVH